MLSPSSSNSNINLLDFSKVGLTTLSDSSAFKKIQYFSKVSPQSLYTQSSIENKYSKISDLYLKSSNLTNTYNYGTLRQHNYTVAASNQYKQGMLDKKSVDTMLNYNYSIANSSSANFSNEHVELTNSSTSSVDTSALLNGASALNTSDIHVNALVENSTMQSSLNSTTDAKGHINPLKYSHMSKNLSSSLSTSELDLQQTQVDSVPSSQEQDSPRTFKFKDLKSPNLGFLSSEKNVRLLDEMNPAKYNSSMNKASNNLNDLVSNSIGDTITPNLNTLYSSSKND
jgi:hypothetical protein